MLHTESLPNHQGIYTPLSQAMTDSESDEEIEIHNVSKHRHIQKHRQLQHLSDIQQPQRNRIPPNTLPLKSQHNRSTVTRIVGGQLKHPQSHKFQLETPSNSNCSSYTTNMQNTFRSVMLSDFGSGGAAELSNFNSEYDVNADNVAILGSTTDETKPTPMSLARRFCFIASLLLCCFAVVGFVWLLPCGNTEGGGACPAPVDRVRTHNWLNNYTKIELKLGGINVVNDLRPWENNLIFLYRGDAFFPEFRLNNHKRNGIISLIGSSGAVAWYDEMVDEPVAIDCTLLDVDGNGRPDCLVIDEYGEMGAINPLSGQWYWRYKERATHKVNAYDFPLILPDLNGDDVLDILLISSVSLEKRTKTLVQQQQQPGTPATMALEARNVLQIISGRDGVPIGDGFRVLDCTQLSKLQLEHALTVTYTCVLNNTEVQRSKKVAELYALITNKSIVGQKLVPASKISQHRHYGLRKDIDSQRNIYSLSGRELVVENRGKCPEDCNVTFVLSEVRNGKPYVLRNFTNSGMYGMVPAQWHFKNTKSKMSGFVMKFWRWHTAKNVTASKQQPMPPSSPTNNVQKNYTNSTMKSTNAISTKDKDKENMAKTYGNKVQQKKQPQQQRLKRQTSPADEFSTVNNEFDAFGHLLKKREAFIVHSKNKTKNNSAQTLLLNNYKMHMITETVILVLFIGADTRIENTSQSNIVQFCRTDRSEVICQPDLNNQENSMLIADLDQDGSQELVSYMSTFVLANEEQDNWKLVTYVRLLRLQAELPAFYDEEKHN